MSDAPPNPGGGCVPWPHGLKEAVRSGVGGQDSRSEKRIAVTTRGMETTPIPPKVERRKEENAMTTMTTCRQCGAEMQKATKVERGGGVNFAAVALFVIGLALLFVFPAGTVIGAFLIVGAFVLGYPRKKVWKCESCGFEHV